MGKNGANEDYFIIIIGKRKEKEEPVLLESGVFSV